MNTAHAMLSRPLNCLLTCLLTCALVAAPDAWAQAGEAADNSPAGERPTKQTENQDPPPGTLRLHLMDGTVITGQLQTPALKIKTEFGDLVVPITSIHQFQPGLEAHPERSLQLQRHFEDLSAPEAERRDRAQEQLASFGPALLPELQQQLKQSDADPERKVRLTHLIETLYSAEPTFEADDGPAASLHRLDTIVTEHFTIAGRVQQQRFNIQSKFGQLEVSLADIKSAERLDNKPTEVRKVVEVTGNDMTVRAYKTTGVRVKRGDKIIIRADGRITMSPWGNNAVSSPDGIAQNGMYKDQIPLGALCGRIGKNGDEFLVGSTNTIVAEQTGTLYLGFAMAANWANYQFPGSYQARIRVVPGP